MDARTATIVRRLDARFDDAAIERLVSRTTCIVSAPRAGSTLLFGLLARGPEVATIGGESHAIYRQFPHLAAENAALDSGALDERHADPETIRRFRLLTLALLRDAQGTLLYDQGLDPERPPVIIEKTPRNALNLPFLAHIFPAARYVHLHRDPAGSIASLAEAWETGARTGQFVTFRALPDWPRGYWCFLLPCGWRAYGDAPVEAVAAFQWRAANEAIIAGLDALPRERSLTISYDQLVAAPGTTLARVARFAGLAADSWSGLNAGALPLSASTVSPPAPEKWRRREAAIVPLLPALNNLSTALDQRTPSLEGTAA